jgi:hypothetical protein
LTSGSGKLSAAPQILSATTATLLFGEFKGLHIPIIMFAPKTSAPPAGGLSINTGSANSLL